MVDAILCRVFIVTETSEPLIELKVKHKHKIVDPNTNQVMTPSVWHEKYYTINTTMTDRESTTEICDQSFRFN